MKPNHPKGSRAYLKSRDVRIEELYLREGLEPREIAAQMLDEASLQAESLDSAMRTVRGVVAKFRKRVDAARTDDGNVAVATSEIDAIERKLVRLRSDLEWHLMVAAGEPDKDGSEAITVSSMDTPQGPLVSSRPKWPAGKRVDARKEAARLAEKIEKIEVQIIEKRDALTAGAVANGTGGGLILIESDKTISELIKENLIVGRFGKKGNDGSSGAAANA